MNASTIQYYNENAAQYFRTTVNADLSRIRTRFLSHLPTGGSILDLGCGSGRDSKAFMELGYKVTALDASEEMCQLAGEYLGQEVLCRDILDIDSNLRFDGVWASASLLHLQEDELKAALREVSICLRPGGQLYASFKYGSSDGYRDGRWYTDMTEDRFREIIRIVGGLYIDEMKITEDVLPGREEQKWLNIRLTNTLYYY